MDQKVSKESVKYRPATGKQQCGNCSMFRIMRLGRDKMTGRCTLVEGSIRADFVCNEWSSGL